MGCAIREFNEETVGIFQDSVSSMYQLSIPYSIKPDTSSQRKIKLDRYAVPYVFHIETNKKSKTDFENDINTTFNDVKQKKRETMTLKKNEDEVSGFKLLTYRQLLKKMNLKSTQHTTETSNNAINHISIWDTIIHHYFKPIQRQLETYIQSSTRN